MSIPKVSVVVPCYNVEKYLNQCIDSIVNQTLKEIEIICVNDGSTDSTLSILRDYEQKDPRVKIIDKVNTGYGNSMNCGFDMANGEYIGIVESDDFIDSDMFEKLYACAKENELDVVKSGFYFYWSKDGEKNVAFPIASNIMASRTFCPTTDFKSKREMVEFFNIKPSIWSAIYRKDFIRENNIRFNETPGASYQDASFNFMVWVSAKKVRLLKECYLHYRQDNEASSINSPGKVYCICDEYDKMANFLETRPIEKGIVEPIMVRIKYDSYNWNYERLSEPLQAEFIHRFAKDFTTHSIDGSLQNEYFEWYKWIRVHRIIEDPDKYHEMQLKSQKGEDISDYIDVFPSFDKENEVSGKKSQWLLNKLIGGLSCIRDHGFGYTLKLGFGKILRRFGK